MICKFIKLIFSKNSVRDNASYMIALYRPCEKIMDRVGRTVSEIKAVGYCLPPVILANVVNCILSNLISQDEEAFLHYIDGMALLWFGFLLLAATVVVQQYSLMKTVGTSILTVCVMLIFVFIGILCVSLVQQVVSFVNSVYSEIVYRV